MNAPTLRCEGIEIAFGKLKAVSNFTYSFEPDRIYGIIGPNGAGKTTLMNALSGRIPLTRGRVYLDGADVSDTPAFARARKGLGRSFQVSQIFPEMTVFENVRVGALAYMNRIQPFWAPVSSYRAIARHTRDTLEAVGLTGFADVLAEKLSHGDRRALELALALVGKPKVLLLDEPLAGVGYEGLQQATDILQTVVSGRTVLLIEHNMSVIMELASTILVMVRGQILAAGPPHEIRSDPRVRAAYLGEGE